VYAIAAAIPLSLAATNMIKVVALAVALVALAADWHARRPSPVAGLRSVQVAMVMLAALALSQAWAVVPPLEGWSAVMKYGSKLILIPVIAILVRTRREASIAVSVLVAVQVFVLLSSCLLYLGVPAPWALPLRNSPATVFSSYLDQSIMTAGLAALCWNLRADFPGRHGRWVAAALALVALANVIAMLPGRSGQVAAIVVVTLALLWQLPRRWLVAGMFAPVALAAAAAVVVPQFRERIIITVNELQAYQSSNDANTSSGQRLTYWYRSLQSMGENPLAGSGAGSWNREYLRLEGAAPLAGTADVRNPHQEYLLWGVQLGALGVALFLTLLAAMVRDVRRFGITARHTGESMVAVFATACLFNSSLYDAVTGEYFCIAFGLLLAYGRFGPAAEVAAGAAPAPQPTQAAQSPHKEALA